MWKTQASDTLNETVLGWLNPGSSNNSGDLGLKN